MTPQSSTLDCTSPAAAADALCDRARERRIWLGLKAEPARQVNLTSATTLVVVHAVANYRKMSKSISEQSCTKLAAARKEFGLLLLTLLLLLQKKLHRRRHLNHPSFAMLVEGNGRVQYGYRPGVEPIFMDGDESAAYDEPW